MAQVEVVRRDAGRRRARLRAVVFGLAIAVPSVIALFALMGLGVSQSVGCGICHSAHADDTTRAESSHVTLECATCHAQSGVTGVLSDGVRAVRWFGGTLVGREVRAVSGNDRRCMSCHESIAEGVSVSRGVAVRHSDFLGTPCGFCHEGSGHRIDGHVYKGPEMDDCLTCHHTAETNLAGCETCHPSGGGGERGPSQTAWRTTHGENWEQAHGMGDLGTCSSCHPRDFCAQCHGVELPHPANWSTVHGTGIEAGVPDSCATCHQATWCSDCHRGVEMPHQPGFLPTHGTDTDELGEDACIHCHDERSCDQCHFESSHPNGPGVTGPHGGV